MQIIWQQPHHITELAGLTLQVPDGMQATQSLIGSTLITGQPCVLKVAQPQSARSVKAVENDLKISARLGRHEALLDIVAAGIATLNSPFDHQAVRAPYFARPKFGRRLLNAWADGQMQDERHIIAVVRTLADLLTHLQLHSVIHGDLSAINVLIDEVPRLKVIDFGSAVHIPDGPIPRHIQSGLREHEPPDSCWTLEYDLFALGQLFFMLTCESSYFEWIFRGRPHLRFRNFISARQHSLFSSVIRGFSSADVAQRRESFELLKESVDVNRSSEIL